MHELRLSNQRGEARVQQSTDPGEAAAMLPVDVDDVGLSLVRRTLDYALAHHRPKTGEPSPRPIGGFNLLALDASNGSLNCNLHASIAPLAYDSSRVGVCDSLRTRRASCAPTDASDVPLSAWCALQTTRSPPSRQAARVPRSSLCCTEFPSSPPSSFFAASITGGTSRSDLWRVLVSIHGSPRASRCDACRRVPVLAAHCAS
jgi:hypothetical protein